MNVNQILEIMSRVWNGFSGFGSSGGCCRKNDLVCLATTQANTTQTNMSRPIVGDEGDGLTR
jgi:hypothetical protein